MSEIMTTEMFVPQILKRSACQKHEMPVGIPCFHIREGHTDRAGYQPGICNERAILAGYNGTPTPFSFAPRR